MPSAALARPSTACGITLCAGGDSRAQFGQLVPAVDGKIVDEAVRFNSVTSPWAHTMLSLDHTFPILNLILFPAHDEGTGVLVGSGVGVGVGVGTGVAVGILVSI